MSLRGVVLDDRVIALYFELFRALDRHYRDYGALPTEVLRLMDAIDGGKRGDYGKAPPRGNTRAEA